MPSYAGMRVGTRRACSTCVAIAIGLAGNGSEVLEIAGLTGTGEGVTFASFG